MLTDGDVVEEGKGWEAVHRCGSQCTSKYVSQVSE